jgi:murein DD-endopeptidase MepM/ murein hydrolase activator NlpD
VSRDPRAWSWAWSIDPPPRHRRAIIPRTPLLGLALAGAVALTPIPLIGTREGIPAPAFVAAHPRPLAGAQPQAPPPLARQSAAGPDPAGSTPDAPWPSTLHGYQWPLPRGRLTQPFGPTVVASRVVGGEPFHDGIDLATFCGDRVVAAHDGVVLAAGRRFDQFIGYDGSLARYFERIERRKLWMTLPIVVVIDDGNGYRSLYAHFSRVTVKPGRHVRAGQLLGFEGATGNASGCHVHYGLFSPLEIDRIAIRRDLVRRWKLPATEIARIDPLSVLPARPQRGAAGQRHPAQGVRRPGGSVAR